MGKIDTQELADMIEAGKSQKDCAEHFDVSPAAICQALRRMRQNIPPESLMLLTDKQRAFVLGKAQGLSNIEAVKQAYDVTTTESAKSMGSQLMQDPHIKQAWSDLLHAVGIGRWRRAERLRDIIEAKDLSVSARGIDLAARMAGDYAPEEVHIVDEHLILSVQVSEGFRRLRDAGILLPRENVSDVPPQEDEQ